MLTDLITNNTIRLLLTLVIVLIIYLLRTGINRLINNNIANIKKRYISRQISNYILLVAAVIIVILLWFEWVQSIFTVLSIAVAALVIVSKELLLNLVANGVIIARELFEAGDRIQIGDHSGDVIETGPLFFSISEIGKRVHGDEPTGRVVKIPNSLVLTQPLINFTKGKSLLWSEISFQLNVDSNWKKAKSIAQDIIIKYSHSFSKSDLKSLKSNSEEIMFIKTDPSVIISYNEGKIILTTRLVCKYHHKNSVDQSLTEELLSAFSAEQDILLIGSEKGKSNYAK